MRRGVGRACRRARPSAGTGVTSALGDPGERAGRGGGTRGASPRRRGASPPHLLEAPHAGEAREGAAELVAVQHSEVSQAQGQVCAATGRRKALAQTPPDWLQQLGSLGTASQPHSGHKTEPWVSCHALHTLPTMRGSPGAPAVPSTHKQMWPGRVTCLDTSARGAQTLDSALGSSWV